MEGHEIDRIARQIGGAPGRATLLERVVDRLTAVIVGSLGTRSWTS